jgi:hypothetical protein
MSLSKSKCWYANNCLHFFKPCCYIVPINSIDDPLSVNSGISIHINAATMCKKLENIAKNLKSKFESSSFGIFRTFSIYELTRSHRLIITCCHQKTHRSDLRTNSIKLFFFAANDEAKVS